MTTPTLILQFEKFKRACASEAKRRKTMRITRKHCQAVATMLFGRKSWYNLHERDYNNWIIGRFDASASAPKSTRPPDSITPKQLEDAFNVVKSLFEKEANSTAATAATAATASTSSTPSDIIASFPNYITLDSLTPTTILLGEGGSGKVLVAYHHGLKVACKRSRTDYRSSFSSSSFGSGGGRSDGDDNSGNDVLLYDEPADDELNKEDPLWEIKRELLFAARVAPCRFVNRYLGAFVVLPGHQQMEEGVFIVQPFFEKGDLRSYMAEQDRLLHPLEVLQLGISLFTAITDCHQLNIGLLDVKIENILVDSSGSAWVTDLGSFIDLKDKEWVNLDKLAVRWTRDVAAPEMLKSRRPRFGKPSDVFMATRILAETMTADLDDLSFGRRVIRRRRDPDGHVTVHPSSFHPCYVLLVSLVLRGLANDPRDRPAAAEALDELARIKEVLISKALEITGMPVGKTGRSPKAIRRAVAGRKGKARVRKQVTVRVDGDKEGSKVTEEEREVENLKVTEEEDPNITEEEDPNMTEEDLNMTEEEDASGEASESSETESESEDMSEYEGARARRAGATPAISTEGVLTRSQRRASVVMDREVETEETPVPEVAADVSHTTGREKTKRDRAGELERRRVLTSAHQQNKAEEGRLFRQVRTSRLVETSLEVEVITVKKRKRVSEREEEGEMDQPRRMTRGRSVRKEFGGRNERRKRERTANRVTRSEGKGKENR